MTDSVFSLWRPLFIQRTGNVILQITLCPLTNARPPLTVTTFTGAALLRSPAKQSLVITCRARGQRPASRHGDLIASLEYPKNYLLLNMLECPVRRRRRPRYGGRMPSRSPARRSAQATGLRAAISKMDVSPVQRHDK